MCVFLEKVPRRNCLWVSGFVEFASIKDAQKAMKRLQHTNIDGHTIQLKLSVQTGNRSKTVKGGNKRKVLQISNATGTKLLLKI